MVKNTTAEVLNGIAYNPKTGTIFVTGKNWIKYLKSPFLSNQKKV
jgi:glutamine cyclotransferase